MSFWKALGGNIKKVFTILATPKVKAVVALGEDALTAEFPALKGIVTILNNWVMKAATVEGIAEAAGEADGTGEQKAAILIADLTPTILADAESAGLPAPTADDIALVNGYVVKILNVLSGASAAKAAALVKPADPALPETEAPAALPEVAV